VGGDGKIEGMGISFSGRYMPEKGPHGKIAITGSWAPTARATIGFDWRPLSEDFTGIGSYLIFNETEMRPAIVFGTSADEFGGTLSQAYHMIASKKILDWRSVTVSPYVGPIYIQELGDWNVVGGVSIRRDKFCLTGMWGGKDLHIVARYDFTDHFTLGVVWWGVDNVDTFGLSTTVKF